MPGSDGGGDQGRRKAHKAFIDALSLPSNDAAAGREPPKPVVVLVGQSSWNNVARIRLRRGEKHPKAEQSYTMLSKVDEKNRGHKIPEAVDEVGGQMLIPTTFLDKWKCPTALASVIGFDEFGAKVRGHLNTLKNCCWTPVVQGKPAETEHLNAVVYRDVRTIFDFGNSYAAECEKLAAESKGLLQRLTTGDDAQLTPTVVYSCKWYVDTFNQLYGEWASRGERAPIHLYETGTFGSVSQRRWEEVEGRIGKHVDIGLASAAFTMRHAKMPLWKGQNGLSDEHWERNDEWIIPAEATSLTEYTRAINGLALDHTEIARMFAESLTEMGLDKFRRAVFRGTFPKAAWWVTTLGAVGMLVVGNDEHKDLQGADPLAPLAPLAYWIQLPYWPLAEDEKGHLLRLNDDGLEGNEGVPIGKREVVCALSCGDVSRAAFVKSTWDSMRLEGASRSRYLGTPELVGQAAQHAAAAGMLKISHLKLESALDRMTWNTVGDHVTNPLNRNRVKALPMTEEAAEVVLKKLCTRAKQEDENQKRWTRES